MPDNAKTRFGAPSRRHLEIPEPRSISTRDIAEVLRAWPDRFPDARRPVFDFGVFQRILCLVALWLYAGVHGLWPKLVSSCPVCGWGFPPFGAFLRPAGPFTRFQPQVGKTGARAA